MWGIPMFGKFFRPALIVGTLPVSLQNGQTADASQVMSDLNFIVNQINANAAQLSLTPQLAGVNTFTGLNSFGTAGITAPVAAAGNVFSDVYTPVMTAGTNCDSVTTMPTQFFRIGNMGFVAGSLNYDPTVASTLTDFLISLPVASAFVTAIQAGGGVCAQGGLIEALAISSDVATGKVKVSGLCGNTTANHPCSYWFMFQIV